MKASDLDKLTELFQRSVTLAVDAGRCQLRTEVAGLRVSLAVVRETLPVGKQVGASLTEPRLSPLDRTILGVLSSKAQTMARLARAAKHANDSYFRSRVHRLRRLGKIASVADGYYLPDSS